MKKLRRPIADGIRRQLTDFYGGRRCVIEGSRENSDWHHLDDDPWNSTFQNLVPLSRDFNNGLEIYRRYQADGGPWIGVNPWLTPEYLRACARHHFRAADVALAYGSNRLITWLIKLYPRVVAQGGNLIDSALDSLSCARHAAAMPLVRDILRRDIRPYIQQVRPSPRDSVRLQQELASLFQEYGWFPQAAELFRGVENMLEQLAPDERNELEVRYLRRVSLANIVESSDVQRAVWMLNEADVISTDIDANTHVGISNARAWTYMSRGEPRRAQDILVSVVSHIFRSDGEYRQNLVTPWNALESLLTLYRLECRGSRSAERKKTVREQLEYTLTRFSRSGIQLRPLALELSLLFKSEKSLEVENIYYSRVVPRQDVLDAQTVREMHKTIALLHDAR